MIEAKKVSEALNFYSTLRHPTTLYDHFVFGHHEYFSLLIVNLRLQLHLQLFHNIPISPPQMWHCSCSPERLHKPQKPSAQHPLCAERSVHCHQQQLQCLMDEASCPLEWSLLLDSGIPSNKRKICILTCLNVYTLYNEEFSFNVKTLICFCTYILG